MVERLTAYLLNNGFSRGQANQTLFTRKRGKHMRVAQISVDYIVFEATIDSHAHEFVVEMSMIGELAYFLLGRV